MRKEAHISRNSGIAEIETSSAVKAFLYKTHCRPILYYGVENLTFLKKDIKNLQTAEATLVKMSHRLHRTSKTKKLLTAVGVEPADLKINKIKLGFFIRIMLNEFTRELMTTLISEYIAHRERHMFKKSLLNDILEISGDQVFESENLLKKIRQDVRSIKNVEKEMTFCGVVDSIKTCLENRNEENDKILKLLVESFKRMKKPATTLENN